MDLGAHSTQPPAGWLQIRVPRPRPREPDPWAWVGALESQRAAPQVSPMHTPPAGAGNREGPLALNTPAGVTGEKGPLDGGRQTSSVKGQRANTTSFSPVPWQRPGEAVLPGKSTQSIQLHRI